jgi:hypothetical protein
MELSSIANAMGFGVCPHLHDRVQSFLPIWTPWNAMLVNNLRAGTQGGQRHVLQGYPLYRDHIAS